MQSMVVNLSCFLVPAPTRSCESDEIDFENPRLNQLMALISTLLTPVRARQEFLPDFSIDFKQTDSPDRNSSTHSDEIWTGKNTQRRVSIISVVNK